MDALFLNIINRSLSASWLILAVLLLRLALKRAPKWISCVLLALVAIRLICPICFESSWSLIPNAEPISQEIFMPEPLPESPHKPALDPGIEPSPSVVPSEKSEQRLPLQQAGPIVATPIWMVGTAAMIIYALFSYIHLRHKVQASIQLQTNVWLCDDIAAPFLFGFFRPRIYVPSGTAENLIAPIIAHENAHLRRKDHWWKPLGYLILAVHWFNPLAWAAFILFCRDTELACDEKVIRNLNKSESIAYSEALLSCSTSRRTLLICPLAFGEVGVKERVKRVLNYQKPAFWVVLAAVVACGILAVCFLTNPKGPREFPMNGHNISNLDTEQILTKICSAEGIQDSSFLYVNADNFDLMLTSDFDLSNSGAIRFFYVEDQNTYSAQLRLFIEDDQYFITERTKWAEQTELFKLRHYLDALRFLPVDEIRKLSPDADSYSIYMRPTGAPDNYKRTVTYHTGGPGKIDGWYIHLEVCPLYEGHGVGEDIIHVFYGPKAEGLLTPISQNNLDNAISTAILEHHTPNKPDGLIHVESHILLADEPVSGTPRIGADAHQEKTTVYLLVLHESFRPDSDPSKPLESVGGDYIPTALTFHRSDAGDYVLDEYWVPRDGGCYADDIQKKFPNEALVKMQNDQDYVDTLERENQNKAKALLIEQGDFQLLAEELIATICSSPAAYSDPAEYIREHQTEYAMLLSYGESTLRYCFAKFLDGGQTDLYGYVMAELCQDLMAELWGMERSAALDENGQAWFNRFYANAQSNAAKASSEELKKYDPASWMVLEMAGEARAPAALFS